MDMSTDPEIMRCPSEEQAMHTTSRTCPSKCLMATVPVLVPQIRIVLSLHPEIIYCPSGEKATDHILPEYPVRGWATTSPVSASQIRMSVSHDVLPLRGVCT